MSLKSNILEAHYSMKVLVVAISSNIISFRFLPISGHLWTIEENQSWSIRSRRSSCNWGKKFSIISKGKIFRADRKKSVYRYLLVSQCQQLCLWHYFDVNKDLYIFSLFYFSFITDNAKPTGLDCVSSNICSCILSLLKLSRTFWLTN